MHQNLAASLPKNNSESTYNPFNITNGISYEFDSSNKMNQQLLKKFSMSLKNVNPINQKKFSNTNFIKNQPISFTETNQKGINSSQRRNAHRFKHDAKNPSGDQEEFNMYKKKFYEKQKEALQIKKESFKESLKEEIEENKNNKLKEKVMLYERKKQTQKVQNKFIKKNIKSTKFIFLIF
jgi:hypothetical protein